jgi:glucose-1-phosphate adenylyltransferase
MNNSPRRGRTEYSHLTSETIALVLAGGNGTRLKNLTRWHVKPAVPFGGIYRNIDFSLSNCVNSGVRRVGVLTQYRSRSLIKHLQEGWSFLPRHLGEFIEVWPAQRQHAGTADAVCQNLDMLMQLAPKHVLILAGDHVYSMDYGPMLERHAEHGADVTVACLEMPRALAVEFGVLHVDDRGRVKQFVEKPKDPQQLFADQSQVLVSMGIYIFQFERLIDVLVRDAHTDGSARDFGKDILPRLAHSGRASAYVFRDRETHRQGYWRDVGTVASYWQTHMELLLPDKRLNLADPDWPIWTRPVHGPPAEIIETAACGGAALANSIVSPGCVIKDAVVRNSVLSPGVRILPGAVVQDSVLLHDVVIGSGCRVERAIIDADVRLADDTIIGEDCEWATQTLARHAQSHRPGVRDRSGGAQRSRGTIVTEG